LRPPSRLRLFLLPARFFPPSRLGLLLLASRFGAASLFFFRSLSGLGFFLLFPSSVLLFFLLRPPSRLGLLLLPSRFGAASLFFFFGSLSGFCLFLFLPSPRPLVRFRPLRLHHAA